MAYFIEFIDVYKALGDRQILNGVTFGVEKGETFAILGPSGVGKTVTLTHGVRFLKPDKHRINPDGAPAGVFHNRPAAATLARLDALFTKEPSKVAQ